MLETRKAHKIWEHEYVERYASDNFFAFSRGELLVVLTNTEDSVSNHIGYLPFKEGDVLYNVFNEAEELTVSKDGINVELNNMEVKIYVKKESLTLAKE